LSAQEISVVPNINPTLREIRQDFAPELACLKLPEADGLVVINEKEIRTTWLGRIFICNLAIVFDPYLEKQQLDSKPLFSKTL
jgi:coproporphyrinogen III oxidase-like Fe-S oxidoreductase